MREGEFSETEETAGFEAAGSSGLGGGFGAAVFVEGRNRGIAPDYREGRVGAAGYVADCCDDGVDQGGYVGCSAVVG